MYPSKLVGPRELIETIPKWGRYGKSKIVIEREGEREGQIINWCMLLQLLDHFFYLQGCGCIGNCITIIN